MTNKKLLWMRYKLEREEIEKESQLSDAIFEAKNKAEYDTARRKYEDYIYHDIRHKIYRNYFPAASLVDGAELCNRLDTLKENLDNDQVYIYLNLPFFHPKRPPITEMSEASMAMEDRTLNKETYEKYLSEVLGESITTEEYERKYGFLSTIVERRKD